MNKYESVVIFISNLSDEQKDDLVNKIKSLISSDGELVSVDEWGKKTFAYTINKQTEGYYVLFTFNSKPEFIAEFERVLRLDEKVLKHIVIKKNK